VEAFNAFLQSIRGGTTANADVASLHRSSVLLELAVRTSIGDRAQAITKALTGIPRAHKLPVPKFGSGFLWKFTTTQWNHMNKQLLLRRVLDCQGRLRFYIDMDVEAIRGQALAWCRKGDWDVLLDQNTHDLHVVSKILQEREGERQGEKEYLVKWEPYDMEDSWETEEIVRECEAFSNYRWGVVPRTSKRGRR
jgi:hypothetical protein